MLPLFASLAILPAVALARPQELTSTQSPEASFLGLSASADQALERMIDVKFSCANRRLGYYADVSNDCKVFHICNPMALPDGQRAIMQYSFFCPTNTRFDQQSLTCVPTPAPLPCHLSEKYYHINDQLGNTVSLPEARKPAPINMASGRPNKPAARAAAAAAAAAAPVRAPVAPAPVRAPVAPAPVRAPVAPAPVRAPVAPAPARAPVAPAPARAPVAPAPARAFAPAAPVAAPVQAVEPAMSPVQVIRLG